MIRNLHSFQVKLISGRSGVGAWHLSALTLALVLALATQLQAVPVGDPEVSGNVQVGAVARCSVDGVEGLPSPERSVILDLVRRHRRGASNDWHEVLADAIYEESLAAEVDPLMVASIVARESSFKSRAVSRVGAVGLMQLRPFVARDVALRSDVEWNGLDTLNDPELNLRLGIRYYKSLVDRFDGDPNKALTAYNFGPTRVSSSLRRGQFEGSRYADGIIELYDRLSAEDTPAALPGS